MYDRDRKLVVPPDGGWGWVVVIAAFVVCAIVDGIAMNAATIYVNFPSFIRAMNAEHAKLPPARCVSHFADSEQSFYYVPCPSFNSSSSFDGSLSPANSGDHVFIANAVEPEPEASFEPMANFFIGATLISMYMLIGPFSAALINVYGSRRIIIIGSVIAACGFSLSALLIEHERILLLTHGVAGGIGLGLMNVGAIVSVGLYFNTRRSLAIGLALCGSGAGMTIAPLVIEPILSEHGLYYAYVVLACFSLQGVVAGVLVRPLRPVNSVKKLQSRRKDVVDRVIEWSKNVKHIRESDSMTSLNNPTKKELVKEQLRRTRQQRILKLEIDSIPSSNVGSRQSMENQHHSLAQNMQPPSSGQTADGVSVSPGIKIDPVFCQVFGSDLISPFPRPATAASTVNEEVNLNTSPSSSLADNPTLSSNIPALLTTNSALAAAGITFIPEMTTPTPPSTIPPPVFFLTLPVPGIQPQADLVELPYSFSKPGTCVCSVLLDGGMLVASKLLADGQKAVAKSCPELSEHKPVQMTEIRLRRRPVTSSSNAEKESRVSFQNHSTKNCHHHADRKQISSTPRGPRRRRQRSYASRFVPSTGPVFESQESSIYDQPEPDVLKLNNGGEIAEPVASQGLPHSRRPVRRRAGAILEDEQPAVPSEERLGCDSGISHSSSSGHSDASDRGSPKQPGGKNDTVVQIFPNKTYEEEKLLLNNEDGDDEHDDSSEDADEKLPCLADGVPLDEPSQSSKSYTERRRKRRQQLAKSPQQHSTSLEPSPTGGNVNVFKHLSNVLEAILDISLLKDGRFWIILFGNLLLMVTFLLLPLNADVVKTIRALDALHAQQEALRTQQQALIQAATFSNLPVSSDQYPIGIMNESTHFSDENYQSQSFAGEDPAMWTPEDDVFGPSELYEPMPHMYAILLSVCGGTQTIVRAVAGFFADYPRVDATVMVTVAMAIGSVAFLLLGIESVLMLGIGVFFALLVVVSACSGVFFALATSVIVDTFGVDRLTSCFGMITMIRGLAPYVTIGFMLSVSHLIESQALDQANDLLPFRYACLLCSGLVLICSVLHGLLYWLRKRQCHCKINLQVGTDSKEESPAPDCLIPPQNDQYSQ